jgi:hypothetical protein
MTCPSTQFETGGNVIVPKGIPVIGVSNTQTSAPANAGETCILKPVAVGAAYCVITEFFDMFLFKKSSIADQVAATSVPALSEAIGTLSAPVMADIVGSCLIVMFVAHSQARWGLELHKLT